METKKTKKVIIALDYDESAKKVAEVGYSMAKAMNAQAVLMHVIYEKTTYYASYPYMGDLNVDFLEDLKVSTQKFLDNLKKQLKDPTIETVLIEGGIADSIIKTAKEARADIIVMGTHGRKGLENILLGSVAESVLKKTRIPLFIIPTKDDKEKE